MRILGYALCPLLAVASLSLPAQSEDSEKVPLIFAKQQTEDLLNGKLAITKWFYSKPLPSGDAKNFSKWYVITSPTAPRGYSVLKTTFETRGDRHCTGGDTAMYSRGQPPNVYQKQAVNTIIAADYAECELLERTPDHVTWRFRLKGHQDSSWKWASGPLGVGGGDQWDKHKGISDGLLSVTYIPTK